jgi:hypothetical protein
MCMRVLEVKLNIRNLSKTEASGQLHCLASPVESLHYQQDENLDGLQNQSGWGDKISLSLFGIKLWSSNVQLTTLLIELLWLI